MKAYAPRILTEAEARRLVAVADSARLRPAIVIWLNTGLRKMELLKLKHEDVDFKEMLLTVVADNSKNGKARTIPISERVAEKLRSLPGEVYFFENQETGRHITELLKSFRTALKRAEIKGRCRIHDLRHTHATWQIRDGVDVKMLSENLGHSDPKITLDLYCHSSMVMKRRAVEKIPDLESRHKVQTDGVEDATTVSESVN